MKRNEYWYPDLGVAEIVFNIDGKEYVGEANCHPDDEDMKSRNVGFALAEMRAAYAFGKDKLQNVYKPQLAILEHIYDCAKSSKKFNPFDNTVRLVRRQIAQLKKEIATLTCDLEDIKRTEREYIADKEWYYKKIREKRLKDKND